VISAVHIPQLRTGLLGLEQGTSALKMTTFWETIPVNMDAIHSMIPGDQRVSAKKIAGTLAISQESVGYIIHETLDMRKLSAKWVPKCLNAVLKRDRGLASQAILDPFRQDPVEFFNCLVTMDETWIHIHDTEIKEQSKKWIQMSKEVQDRSHQSMVLASIIWDKN
jgi:histone-lysine N-methyltransferase SETMAR